MSFFAKIFKYNEKSTQIQGLNDSLKALYVYDYFNHDKDSILVVTNTLFEANKFYQEIYSYTKDVLLFPMDDFLTSEALAKKHKTWDFKWNTWYKKNCSNKFNGVFKVFTT